MHFTVQIGDVPEAVVAIRMPPGRSLTDTGVQHLHCSMDLLRASILRSSVSIGGVATSGSSCRLVHIIHHAFYLCPCNKEESYLCHNRHIS